MYNLSNFSAQDVIKNYKHIIDRIKKASDSVNRDYEEVHLIVVTKTFDTSVFMPLIDIGHKDFGENKVQEAQNKWSPLLNTYEDIRLHLIGHLQTNKVKKAMELFYSIHTIDSTKRVSEVIKNINNLNNRCEKYFIELNMAQEIQKSGLKQNELIQLLDLINESSILGFDGLMCIPPYDEEPSPYFMLLNKIAKKNNLTKLSMGMSADFEKAIQFGATHVRVGSEIFGSRS
jgi:pyridoxal phosphate enzyme (YggS family)